MPGITGIIQSDVHRDIGDALDSMIQCMVHEPSSKRGKYVEERLGLLCGWVCHENTFSDCLPVWNERRDICLLYRNGL